MPTLLTVGHGTLPSAEFSALLSAAGVGLVVDVRRYPGSRRHPQFARDAMASWLPDAGMDYRWEPRLGGRRTPSPANTHTGLTQAGFRAYAEHMETDEFRTALGDVLAAAASKTTAVMCAEGVWWRCHRRLVADAAVLLHGWEVRHLFHDGRIAVHQPTTVAARVDDRLVYR